MGKKVYLLWHSYVSRELLVVGSLSKNDEKKYVFKYEDDALKASKLGCFLPFPYVNEEYVFSALPNFFSQRILSSEFYINKFNIDYDFNDEFKNLTYGNCVRNTDNFSIVSEEDYIEILSSKNNGFVNGLVRK